MVDLELWRQFFARLLKVLSGFVKITMIRATTVYYIYTVHPRDPRFSDGEYMGWGGDGEYKGWGGVGWGGDNNKRVSSYAA